MSTEPIPQDLVAVHDLLRETLAASRDSGSGLGYGIAIFPRTGRFGAPVFGIATSGGESTVLTYRMLQSLVEVPVYVSGRIPATCGRTDYVTARDSRGSFSITRCCEGRPHVSASAPVADDLERTQPLDPHFAAILTHRSF
jgi:hypothetical protein